MKLVTFFASLFLNSQCSTDQDLKADYYVALIKTNIARIAAYRAPNRTVGFDEGLRQNSAIDCGTYDFIIIGAGSAGSVLATRLSEIERYKILLLEAGGEENDFTDIPYMHLQLLKSDIDWGYKTTPQKDACYQYENHQCALPRGKVIGGTSTINSLHFTRCNRLDYEKWVLLGNTQWGYQEVLPYFKKMENFQIQGDKSYHGRHGPINIEYSEPDLESYAIFAKANEELGLRRIDYNGRQQIGYSKWQHNTKLGKRHSTGRAYLSNAYRRPNLKVITKALATKLIIDSKTKTAQGVYFIHENKKCKALAKKEVILSAGAYNTPQLLMLSGLGPKEHLEELGIDLVHNIPSLGENFYEHPTLKVNFKTNHKVKKLSLRQQVEMYLNGTGPLTKTTNIDSVAFWSPNAVRSTLPKFEYFLGEQDNLIYIGVNLIHAKSLASFKLKSKDPTDLPIIELNLLSNPEDSAVLDEAIRFILYKLAKTKAFRSINATFTKIPEDCEKFSVDSNAFLVCFKKQLTETICHPYGTVRMGVNPINSVVDQSLRVYGIEKLRIIDASVIPTTMSGHLNAVVIMIAEKASDMLKKVYK